jgi:hypothetical protein
MLAIRRAPHAVARWVLGAVLGAAVIALVPASAQAIPYFNEDFGFDNSSLMLDAQFAIPNDASFPPVASGNTTNDIGLLSDDVINDTSSSIDRTVTWTIINNEPETITEFLIFLTALAPTPTDYSGANIDVGIDTDDPMVIATFGPYFLAGFHLTLDDFSLVSGDLIVTRTFSYTVDVPEGAGGPPALGIAYTPMFMPVPEPATGLLFAGAVLLAVGAGRKPDA